MTPDALKGMAKLIAPSSTADPLAYSTNVDTGLRVCLDSRALADSWQAEPGRSTFLAGARFFFLVWRSALAAEPAVTNLNQMLPDPKDLQ